jgi:predicted RNase H-like HicB family nuclease
MKTYTYTVLLAPGEDGGFRVQCPALPGVRAYGDTRKEAIENIRISISHKLDVLIASGRPIPRDGDQARHAAL